MIKVKTPEEIIKKFNITNGIIPYEEVQVQEEKLVQRILNRLKCYNWFTWFMFL